MANGGAKVDENCVVCCKAVNIALGHLSVKAKMQAVLNHRGGFSCPMAREASAISMVEPEMVRLAVVLADLHKRGSARPRRVATLKNTINASFQMKLSAAELDAIVAQLQAKRYVIVEDTKVSYSLPVPGA